MLKRISLLLISLFLSCALLTEDKHFVIDICSYNNKNWHRQNLDSVFNQTYKNFRVFYTNDCSSDGTNELVAQYIKENELEDKITLINNTQRQRMLSNHWRVIHQCQPDEIIIHLDGDDFFAHDNVLEKLNEIYQNDNVWMTFGSYRFWPHAQDYIVEQIPDVVIKRGTYRKHNFKKSPYHPRSFYAWLAQQIKLEDLLYHRKPFAGQFIPAISDWSLMYPLFEMAAGRYKILAEVLYQFNVVNPLNHDKDKRTLWLQHVCAAFICRKKPYEKLEQKQIINREEEPIDIFILDDEDADLLHWLEHNFTGYRNIISRKKIDPLYCSDYVCCIMAKYPGLYPVDLRECNKMLKQTHAQFFFIQLSKMPLTAAWIKDNVYAFIKRHNEFPKSNIFICHKHVLMSLLQKKLHKAELLINLVGIDEPLLFFKN